MHALTPHTRNLSRLVLPIAAAAFAFGVAVGEAHAFPGFAADLVGDGLDGAAGHAVEIGAGFVGDVLRFDLSLPSLFFNPHSEQGHASACGGVRLVGFAFLGLAALVVIALGRMRHATEQTRLGLARQFVEQGIEPPPELLGGVTRNDLRRGVVLLSAGAGLLAAALLTGHQPLAPGGLIPAFIGFGYLVSYRLTMREHR